METDLGNTTYFGSVSMLLNVANKLIDGNLLSQCLAHGEHVTSGSSCLCCCCGFNVVIFIHQDIRHFLLNLPGEEKYLCFVDTVVCYIKLLSLPHSSSLVKFLKICVPGLLFPSSSTHFCSCLLIFSPQASPCCG